MIQKGSLLNVVDNSGAKRVSCIHIYNGYRKRYARTGDLIKVSIKAVRTGTNIKIKKGDVVKAIVVECKSPLTFFSGSSKVVVRKSVVLISNQNNFLGTRIFSFLDSSFKSTRYLRVLTLSNGVSY